MYINQTKFIVESETYLKTLSSCFNEQIYRSIAKLASDLKKCWMEKKNVYICGNGGSSANAIHLANDFHYGIGACGTGGNLPGLKVEALSSNQGVITCLGNDIGYENIFSHQLQVKANIDDLLIVLSGSGNSKNIINAIEVGKKIGMKSYAIIAFQGGECLDKADNPIHFPIEDMQIAEDTQLIIGHICMQWLSRNKPSNLAELDL